MKEDKLTTSLVAGYLIYDPETGLFAWRKSPAMCVPSGAMAGHLRPDGYMQIRFKRSTFLSHRLVCFVMTGAWPAKTIEVDHINGDRADNRWVNLRLATKSQNQFNRKPTSGRPLPKGVTPSVRGKPYKAAIAIDGRQTHIGVFETVEEASAAYETAARSYVGDYSRAA